MQLYFTFSLSFHYYMLGKKKNNPTQKKLKKNKDKKRNIFLVTEFYALKDQK